MSQTLFKFIQQQKTPRSFTFQGQLVMSEGVTTHRDIPSLLLQEFPLAVKVEKSNREDERKGIDYWVTLQSGRRVGIDMKVRKEDGSSWGWDDVALETWSVIEKQVIGWTRNPEKQTDYILWYWKDTGRWLLLPFPELCRIFIDHWEDWSITYKRARQLTENSPSSKWHSECVFVPRGLLLAEITIAFGGVPA